MHHGSFLMPRDSSAKECALENFEEGTFDQLLLEAEEAKDRTKKDASES